MDGWKKIFTIIIFQLILVTIITAQEIDLSNKISLVVRNKPLKSALDQISKKGNILFSYSNEQVNDKQIITIVARKQSIESVFSKLFSELGIDFLVVEKQVILKPKVQKNESVTEVKPNIFTISGYLKDSETNEVLIGAAVRVDGTILGTVSNSYGFYSLTLPSDNYLFKYSYIGYESKIIPVKLSKDKKISQKLALDETDLDVIIVTDRENVDILEINPLKKLYLTSAMINKTPNIGGEPSVVKTLNSIPGISPYGDGSVLFYVRGGNKDQNLIIVDEAPIYNPSHMLGFFSSIAPDAINSISVNKGNFPVQYGGRLSSFVDVRTKDGNMNHFSFHGNFSPFTGSLSLEGPIVKEKASYIATLRTSTLNWIFKQQPGDLKMDFYDFHTKLNFKFNRKNRLFLSLYSGSDFIESFKTGYNTYAMSWQNIGATIRWNHLFSDRFFSNLTIYTSKYDYFLYSSIEDNQYWNSFIGNLSLKNDFTYYINPDNTLRFGFELNFHYFNPGNQNDEFFEEVVSSSSALQEVIYFGNEIKFSNKFSLNYSIRGLNWNNTGPAVIYNFNDNYTVKDSTRFSEGTFHSYFNTEPQIEILYALNKSTSFKLGYNHHIQYLNLLSNSVSPFTTLDVWMPAGPNIKPQKSDQYVIGFHKKTAELIFTAEAYYKKMYNQIDYANHANMFLNPLIEGELRFGTATSYGVELFLNKQKGDLTGWLGYSYIRTYRKIKDVNNNENYPVVYDKPHYITLNLSYKLHERWLFNLNWVYSSGLRFSSPTGFYYYQGYSVPIYSEKNNSKLPEYHRMDVSASFQLNKKPNNKFKHHLIFSLYNLYGRENPISVNYNKIETSGGSFVIPSDFISESQIVPTAIHLFGVVPSLTYRFKFK
ncbi:MAG: TonB-dependent receptor [Bacteroidota bacterium]